MGHFIAENWQVGLFFAFLAWIFITSWGVGDTWDYESARMEHARK